MEPTFETFGLSPTCTCGAQLVLAWDGASTVVIYHAARPIQTINAPPNGRWPKSPALTAALAEIHAAYQPA